MSARRIDNRPIMHAGEVLEAVPGSSSPAQWRRQGQPLYLRGFNLDHGTDFAASVYGVPVNVRTQCARASGIQPNFLIPELISGVQFNNKGPYAAERG